MVENDCGEIPVVESQATRRVLGVITDRDIAIRTVAQGRNPLEMKVAECMTSPACTVLGEAAIEDCLQLMQEQQIRRVPVVDAQGQLCGIVSQADIAGSLSPRETGKMVREVSEPGSGQSTTH
jgi:CBS domain-containing protein